MKLRKVLPFTLFLTCALMAAAHADIKYTQTMTFSGAQLGFPVPVPHTTHFVAPGKERNETEMSIGSFKSKEALVTLCKSDQTIHIDDALKIYAITDKESDTATIIPLGHNAQSKEKAGTGKIVVNVKITDLQPEKVADWDTKHYMVEMHTQSSGCVGDSSSDIKMELWVADVKDAHGCKATVDYGALLGRREGGKCKVTSEITGDFARLADIWDGLVMRQKMYKNGRVMMAQEVTSLSQAKLDDSIFDIPDGYNKLSIDEYNKKRQQAMMESIYRSGSNVSF